MVKGQISLGFQPVMLVIVIVLLLTIYYSFNIAKSDTEKAERELIMRNQATSILLLLANSEKCLAYSPKNIKGVYANIINVSKLEKFVEEYKGIEPLCARDYRYGYVVRISEIDYKGNEIKNWTFGAKNFSFGKSLFLSIKKIKMPVALRYNEKEVALGMMELDIYSGELELLSGFLDRSCVLGMEGLTNKTSFTITLSYPVSYNNRTICIGEKYKSCRKLLCNLEFEGIPSPGKYRILTYFKPPNILIVRI